MAGCSRALPGDGEPGKEDGSSARKELELCGLSHEERGQEHPCKGNKQKGRIQKAEGAPGIWPVVVLLYWRGHALTPFPLLLYVRVKLARLSCGSGFYIVVFKKVQARVFFPLCLFICNYCMPQQFSQTGEICVHVGLGEAICQQMIRHCMCLQRCTTLAGTWERPIINLAATCKSGCHGPHKRSCHALSPRLAF